jgi:hypothetical protein
MKYELVYFHLIESRKLLSPSNFEKHHIIPQCLGGTNEPSNIVKLTPREHFLAHRLLAKMYPEHGGLLYAANMMSKYKKSRCKIYNGRKITEEHRNIISVTHKGKQLTPETKLKISEKLKTHKPSLESNLKRSETLRGRISPMKGKISKMKGQPRSPEVLQKAWETRRKNLASADKPKV